jgi:hypothetical protein
MSRVTYTDTPATVEQEALRVVHQVRLVSEVEEGTGANALPDGIYGFTYSPGLPNAPLFADRRYGCYELHKVSGGEIFIVGFVDVDVVRQLQAAMTDVTVSIQPEPERDRSSLVTIPYSRIRHHRQHAAPNQHGFAVTVMPAPKSH